MGSPPANPEVPMYPPLSPEAYEQRIEEMIAEAGGAAGIAESLRRFGERCDLFDRRRNELTAQYPDQFVAMAADDTIIASATLDGLFDEIDRRGIDREYCIVEFLDAEPVMYIL